MATHLNPAHVHWTRQCLLMLTIGGIWGIPRSGVTVQRTSTTTVTITPPNWETLEPLLRSYIEASDFTIEPHYDIPPPSHTLLP